MKATDPHQVIWSLRKLEQPVCPVLAAPRLGLEATVQLTAALLQRDPPAIGFLGLDPNHDWYSMEPNPDLWSTVQPCTIELEEATIRVVPSTSEKDPWVALVLEPPEPSVEEDEIDPHDRSREAPETSRSELGEAERLEFHTGLLRQAGLTGMPALEATGVVDERGEATRSAKMCLARGVAPPVPPSWTIVVERYDADPRTVERRDLEAVETRTLEPPLPFAIDAIVDELSVEPPFLHRDSRYATVALREVLVNAIVHRSYAEHDDEPVRVVCHPDRVVVDSPGTWAGSGDETNEAASDGTESIPNPDLHALMARLGLCQQQGMGLERARLHARAIGMRIEVQRWDDGVWTSLIVDRQLSLELGAPGPRRGSTTRKPASVREERVMEFLNQRESASKKEIAGALEIPEPTVAVTLKKLRDRGMVAPTERAARSPRQRYRITKGQP